MTRPYIELCRDLVAELGVAGGSGPASVEDQRGELKNIVRWVAESDVYVQNLWTDWNFLWTFNTGNFLLPGASTIPTIVDFNHPVENGLVLFSDTPSPHRPKWMEWDDFRMAYGASPVQSQVRPSAWTQRPDGLLVLSQRTMAAETHWTIEYHRTPARMMINTDISPLPIQFERIILARAAIMYGTREDAPELISGYGAEYADTLSKLEGSCLPNQRPHVRARTVLAQPNWVD